MYDSSATFPAIFVRMETFPWDIWKKTKVGVFETQCRDMHKSRNNH